MTLITQILVWLGILSSAFLLVLSIVEYKATKSKSLFWDFAIAIIVIGAMGFTIFTKGCYTCTLNPIRNIIIYSIISAIPIFSIIDILIKKKKSTSVDKI